MSGTPVHRRRPADRTDGIARRTLETVAATVCAAGLVAYAGVALAYPAYRAALRFPTGTTQEERRQLDLWACAERVLSRVPPGSSVVIGDAPDLGQRLIEYGYPRLDFSGRHPPTFRFVLDDAPPSADANTFASEWCGDRWFRAVRVGS